MTQYWYNLKTKGVEKGPQSSWRYLLGPYDTPEQAQNALDHVAQRNEFMDEIEESEKEEDH